MKRFFGKKKEEVQPQVNLEDTSNLLGKKSEDIDKQIADINKKLSEITKQMKMPSNKSRLPTLRRKATELLKRRKMYENFQGKIDGQRFNIDNMAFQQQQIKVNIDTVQAMKQSNAAMKQTMKQFTVEDVDDMALDMEDMMAESNEISDILSQGIRNDIDEGELEDELAALEAEGLDEGELDMEGIDEPGGKTPEKETW